MSIRAYYADIGDGLTETSLNEIRRRCMDELWSAPVGASLTVYSGPSRRRAVGSVVRGYRTPFLWVLNGKSARTLLRNGSVYDRRTLTQPDAGRSVGTVPQTL
jgi:hypothetical protein